MIIMKHAGESGKKEVLMSLGLHVRINPKVRRGRLGEEGVHQLHIGLRGAGGGCQGCRVDDVIWEVKEEMKDFEQSHCAWRQRKDTFHPIESFPDI